MEGQAFLGTFAAQQKYLARQGRNLDTSYTHMSDMYSPGLMPWRRSLGSCRVTRYAMTPLGLLKGAFGGVWKFNSRRARQGNSRKAKNPSALCLLLLFLAS